MLPARGRTRLLALTLVMPATLACPSRTMGDYQSRQTERALKAYRARQLSLQELPPVVTRADDQLLVLRTIDDHPVKFSGSHVEAATIDRPSTAIYFVTYKYRESDTRANPEAVYVRVRQYPTPEWAAYAIRLTTYYDGVPSGFGHERVRVKFRNRILERRVGDAFNYQDYRDFYWQSGVFVVRVSSSIARIDEFIRLYLERFPSSM